MADKYVYLKAVLSELEKKKQKCVINNEVALQEAYCYDDFEKLLNAAPYIEIKNGKWIERPESDSDYGVIYSCSECGSWFYLDYGTPESNSFHYCPNCGIRNILEVKNKWD